jgi:hypothetical protein
MRAVIPRRRKPDTVGMAVIPLVGMDFGGSSAPPPRWRAHRRDGVDNGLQHGHVNDVGGGHRGGQRQPVAVADQVELAPRLATIDRICANLVPSALGAHAHGVHAGPRPVQPALLTRPVQNVLVESVEHPGIGPLGEPAPAGRQ